MMRRNILLTLMMEIESLIVYLDTTTTIVDIYVVENWR
jgi:hypothetical protein